LRYVVLAVWLCGLWFPPPLPAAGHEPMLPLADDGRQEIAGWWLSEKLDGVRGYWDGENLWSKHGRQLTPPAEFIAGWPPFPLEGELWGGRGRFEATAATVARREAHAGWLELRFGVFDVPAATGAFAVRIARAERWFADHPTPYAFVIPQHPLRDRRQLQKELSRIERLGGEGVVVRNPSAPYAAGRSAQVLKVKSSQDAEALVITHLPGKGRLSGMMGALLVALPDGTRFRIGSGFTDAQRRQPPAPGTVITFRYRGFHPSGIPRFPSFLRVRSDSDL